LKLTTTVPAISAGRPPLSLPEAVSSLLLPLLFNPPEQFILPTLVSVRAAERALRNDFLAFRCSAHGLIDDEGTAHAPDFSGAKTAQRTISIADENVLTKGE
jgi:hypothetical protein